MFSQYAIDRVLRERRVAAASTTYDHPPYPAFNEWRQIRASRRKKEVAERKAAAKAALAAEIAARPKPEKKPRPPESRDRRRRNEWFRNRLRTDPKFALNRRVRHAMGRSLRGGKGGRSWSTLAPYTLDDLRAHLEAKFTPGMGWHNIGAWHLDHKRPLESFAITGPDCPEFQKAWALSNLQPLWKLDNLRKGAKWDGVSQETSA